MENSDQIKLKINWFPGHMKKNLNELESKLKFIDMAICVLDARAPYSCMNPILDKMFQNKYVCYCINKTDLANETVTKSWLNYFKSLGKTAVVIDATKSSAKNIVEKVIFKVLNERKKLKTNKAILTKFRVAIVGVPNTGKSTLLNTLAKGYMSKTGNIAGVTKGSSWIKLGNEIELMDNAGTLYPKFSDEKTAENIAILGSINDAVVNQIDLAKVLLKKLKLIASNKLSDRYSIYDWTDNLNEDLEKIAKSRGFVLRGGELDLDRTATTIIDDYRKGRIGKISLETVEERTGDK